MKNLFAWLERGIFWVQKGGNSNQVSNIICLGILYRNRKKSVLYQQFHEVQFLRSDSENVVHISRPVQFQFYFNLDLGQI